MEVPTRADRVKAKCTDTPAVAQSFAQAYANSQRDAQGIEMTAPEVTAEAPSMEVAIDFTINGASEFNAERPDTIVAARKVDRLLNHPSQNLRQQARNTSETEALKAAADAGVQRNPETIATAGGSLMTQAATFEVVQAPTTTPATPPTAPATPPRTAAPSFDSEVNGACPLVSVAAWLLPVLMWS